MTNTTSIRLKACRKRSGLQQIELGQLVGLQLSSTISRFEHGQRLPDTRVLLAYSLVFDRPCHELLPCTTRKERKRICANARKLIQNLQSGSSVYDNRKIAFLENLVKRIQK